MIELEFLFQLSKNTKHINILLFLMHAFLNGTKCLYNAMCCCQRCIKIGPFFCLMLNWSQGRLCSISNKFKPPKCFYYNGGVQRRYSRKKHPIMFPLIKMFVFYSIYNEHRIEIMIICDYEVDFFSNIWWKGFNFKFKVQVMN